MSKPSVAVFSLAYHPFVGGAEVALKEVISRNPNSDFVLLTKRFDRAWPSAESFDNCSILRLGRGKVSPRSYYGGFFGKIIYIFQAVRVAEKIHRSQPFSVIWGMMASYAGIAALIFKLRNPSVPFLLTLQEGDSESHILRKVGIFYPIWKKIFKKADHIQVISSYLADFAKRHGATCPIEVVPNGVELGDYQEKHGSMDTVITTSRLVYKNGVDTLIKAFVILRSKFGRLSARLVIVGDGPDREKLITLARRLDASNHVEFSGNIDPDEVPGKLAGASIFVRASRSEGLGNSFLEAMAAGLPVIGTPVGGIPDFLRDGETGIFCRVDNPEDLAEKMNLLMENKDLYKKVAEAGRDLVTKKYSWNGIAEKIGLILKKLCEF